MKAVRATALVVVVALGVGLAIDLTHRASRVASDNGLAVQTGILVRPHQVACQVDESIPAGVRTLRTWVSTAGRIGGRLALTVHAPGGAVLQGATTTPYRDSQVDFLLARPPGRDLSGARVCVRNQGAVKVALMGSGVPAVSRAAARAQRLLHAPAQANLPATVDGRTYSPPVRMRLEWHWVDSWAGMSPAIARRVSYERPSFFGTWTFWMAVAVAVAAAAGGLALMTREVAR